RRRLRGAGNDHGLPKRGGFLLFRQTPQQRTGARERRVERTRGPGGGATRGAGKEETCLSGFRGIRVPSGKLGAAGARGSEGGGDLRQAEPAVRGDRSVARLRLDASSGLPVLLP